VGTVVLNYLAHKSGDASQQHSLLALDDLNPYAVDLLSSTKIEYSGRCHSRAEHISSKIREADVVLLHWWNHPLITDLLVRHRLPACRLALWSHISGSPSPNNFTLKTFEYPDEFVFTTPLSYFDPEFVGLPHELKGRVSSIWSTGGVERLADRSPVEHDGFNIGYIGNLDFTKIHPNFVDICEMVDIPDVRFTVVGPLTEKLVQMVEASGMADRVRFTGFVSEEQKWEELCRFDLFGYPLAPHHYGTCDQTLQEAMAVGIVPVVMDNPMESYMIKHEKSGLVAHSVTEYVEYVRTLYLDQGLRRTLSRQAREQAFSVYSLERMSASWDTVFTRLMQREKQEKSWPMSGREMTWEPHRVFLESLGRHAGVFVEHLNPKHVSRLTAADQLRSLGKKYNWSSENKSTVHQFTQFFPEDTVLAEWSRLMKGSEEKSQ